jgi:subtilisin family serine protease
MSIRPDDLHPLDKLPGLMAASLPTRYRMRMDQAGELTGLPQARMDFGLSGAGVLVAVIDTGLDFAHPDFIDDQGGTRVAWLLDQTREPDGRHPELEALGLGSVYDSEDLQAVLDGQAGPALGAGLDILGHGTHVAGIAASDDPVYTGGAPQARLVVVKAISSDLSGFQEDRILAALAFVDRVAELEDQPLVINLSLGNQMGAHDGTEPLELALSDLAARQGRAVVVAAGNEAGRDMHVRGAVSRYGPPLVFPLGVPHISSGERPALIVMDFWYDGEPEVRVWVETPSGHLTEPVSAAGPAVGLESWTPDGFIELACQNEPRPPNQAHRAMLTLTGEAGQPLSPGTWKVFFEGQAFRVDGWVGEYDLPGALGAPRFLDRIDPGTLVGPPASGKNVIAVGAYTSRTEWIDSEGLSRSSTGQVGGLEFYSVEGPTRDGRLKPEVVAPGGAVGSSLSADSEPRSLDSIFYHAGSMRNVLPDGRHALSSGTSMASPLVAGLVALVFERNRTLSGAEIRDLLSVTTHTDPYTGHGALYSPGWGFGKANAVRLLKTAAGESAGPFDPAQSLCGASVAWLAADPNATVLIATVPRDASGLPLGPGQLVEIQATDAVFADVVTDHMNGIYTRTLRGEGQRGTDVIASCKTNGGTASATARVRLAASHQELVGSGVTGGACSCSGSSVPELVVILALLAVLGLLRRGGVFCHHVGDDVITPGKRPK